MTSISPDTNPDVHDATKTTTSTIYHEHSSFRTNRAIGLHREYISACPYSMQEFMSS